jgi:hypothetical protein
MVSHKGIDDLSNIALENIFKFIQREPNTVVCDTALGKVICPDPLATVTASHLTPAICRDFFVLLRNHLIV